MPVEVTGVTVVDGGYKRLALSNGSEVATRTLLVATGMAYREHEAPGVAEHAGAGVYYGAATTEGSVFTGRRVLVVGGGNSAGQGALFLARYAREVDIVIRQRLAEHQQEADGSLVLPEIDDLIYLVEEMAEHFVVDRFSQFESVVWQRTQILAAYKPSHLRQHRQFTGIIRLTFSATTDL